MSDDTGVDHAE